MRAAWAWLLFALAAAIPAGTLLALALRSENAELARDREERTAARAAGARDFGRDIEAWTARARDRVAALTPTTGLGDAQRTLARDLAPYADVVAVDFNGAVLVPAPPTPLAPPTSECRDAARRLSTNDRTTAAAYIVEHCRTVQADGGRFLWPLIALETGKLAAVPAWLDEHALRLGETERSVLLRRIATTDAPAPVRDAITRALARVPAVHAAIVASLSDLSTTTRDDAGIAVTRGGTLTVLRELPIRGDDGVTRPVRVGYVVREPSLLAAPGLAVGYALARGLDPRGVSNVELSPLLRFHVVETDAPARDAEARSRARRGTFVAVLGIALAVTLAAFWFARARRAQKLADLRTDFVAAVSHELRTPVASARMLAELLERGEVAPDERAEVEHVLAGETRRLAGTLDRMLRFGALARGKLSVEIAPMSLATFREEAAARFRAAHPDRTLVVSGSDTTIDADAGLLALAVDNLLGNAVKYAPEGGPYCLHADVEGDEAVLAVTDRGPGLDRAARARVFLPFERADDRLSRATEGTGVGLALVRGIARAHGGDATVRSRENGSQETTFAVRVPRQRRRKA